MTKPINVHDAKTHFSHYLDRAHGGEEIVLSKAGKPYAKLVPLDSTPGSKEPRKPGGWPGRLTEEFWEPLPPGWDGN
jgi:prevent-host-death family protein